MDGYCVSDHDPTDNSVSTQDATTEEASGSLVPKLLIAPIAVLIAAVLIGLPVLRILTADDEPTVRNQAASDARGQVAVLFASAALESRSISIARRYAVEEIHEQVEAVVADLMRRDPQDLQGAVARTSRTTCASIDDDQECFNARLVGDGQEPVIEISFVVGIVNGAARVVAIGNTTTVLLHPGGRRS